MKRDGVINEINLAEFLIALFTLGESGQIPSTIYTPYDYTPTSIAQDIGNVTGSVTESVVRNVSKNALPLGLIAALAIGAYAFFSGGYSKAPKLFSR
jgi:hypothetical protein